MPVLIITHRRRTGRFGERQLDQLFVVRLVVERPGHHQSMRTLDHPVLASRPSLSAVRAPHHHPDLPARAEIDGGDGCLPVGAGVKPAPQHLRARPRIEHLLGRRREGPLDPHDSRPPVSLTRSSFRSSRYSPTTSNSLSHRSRWRSIQSAASASASGLSANRCVLPSITRVTTPASSSSFRWREIVGFETPKSRVTSPTVAVPALSRSTMSRRSGWARALNVSLAILLTIYGTQPPGRRCI